MHSFIESFNEFKVSLQIFFMSLITEAMHKMEFVRFVSKACALVGCQCCQIHLMVCCKKEDINIHTLVFRLAMEDMKRNYSKIYCARKNERKSSGSGVSQNGMHHIFWEIIYEVRLKSPKFILLLLGTVFV